jgi:hypothetical protein
VEFRPAGHDLLIAAARRAGAAVAPGPGAVRRESDGKTIEATPRCSRAFSTRPTSALPEGLNCQQVFSNKPNDAMKAGHGMRSPTVPARCQTGGARNAGHENGPCRCRQGPFAFVVPT